MTAITDMIRTNPRQAAGFVALNLQRSVGNRLVILRTLASVLSTETNIDTVNAVRLESLMQVFLACEDIEALIHALQGKSAEFTGRLHNVSMSDVGTALKNATEPSSNVLRTALGFCPSDVGFYARQNITADEQQAVEKVAEATVGVHLTASSGIKQLAEFSFKHLRFHNVYKHVPGSLLLYSHTNGKTGVSVSKRDASHELVSIKIGSEDIKEFMALAQYAKNLCDQMITNFLPRTCIDDDAHFLPSDIILPVDPAIAKLYRAALGRCPGGLTLNGYSHEVDGVLVTFTNPNGGSGVTYGAVQ